MTQLFDRAMQNIDVNAADSLEIVKKRLAVIFDIPWDKMSLLANTPKTAHLNHLVDALKNLWDEEGKRPCKFTISLPTDNPQERTVVVDIELLPV